jgi:predicted secreted protein
MIRHAAATVSGLLVAASLMAPALAGDRALLDIIGYSEDSRYFAFEEFGVQDGSGFAYSTIYIIDTVEDSWVVGTPIRIRADGEEAALHDVRQEARAEVQGDLEALHIAVPAEIVALVGDGVPGADGSVLRFGNPGYDIGSVLGDYQLHLDTYPVTATSPCKEWFGSDPLGFDLTLTEMDSSSELHRDEMLPRSRGCPQAYRLYGVALPFQAQDLMSAVAIVSYYPGGFEGPDRRFLAVPFAD